MTVVHFSTEVSGGAGLYAKAIHETMLSLDVASLLITREPNDIPNSIVVKPFSKLGSMARWRWKSLQDNVGVLASKYAMFGLDNCPVKANHVEDYLKNIKPKLLIFYWVSWLVDFQTIYHLKKKHPHARVIFVCLDEGFLAGGCHYAWGCRFYGKSCVNCPSTNVSFIRKRVKQELSIRAILAPKINPLVLYPSTTMKAYAEKSDVVKGLKNEVLPLGAVSLKEQFEYSQRLIPSLSEHKKGNKKLTILVRSSAEPRKGCQLFIDAIIYLNSKLHNLKDLIRVISIGDSTISSSEVGTLIEHEYLGYIDRQTLLKTYQLVDVFVVTSLEDAGPIMINECVALNKYVISTPVGVANDLIENNKNGTVLHNFESETLGVALMEYITHKYHLISEKRKSQSNLTFEGYVTSIMSYCSGQH